MALVINRFLRFSGAYLEQVVPSKAFESGAVASVIVLFRVFKKREEPRERARSRQFGMQPDLLFDLKTRSKLKVVCYYISKESFPSVAVGCYKHTDLPFSHSVAFVCLLVVSTLRVRYQKNQSSWRERERKNITGYILIFWRVRALCGEMVHAQSTLTQPENVFHNLVFCLFSFISSLFPFGSLLFITLFNWEYVNCSLSDIVAVRFLFFSFLNASPRFWFAFVSLFLNLFSEAYKLQNRIKIYECPALVGRMCTVAQDFSSDGTSATVAMPVATSASSIVSLWLTSNKPPTIHVCFKPTFFSVYFYGFPNLVYFAGTNRTNWKDYSVQKRLL